MPRGRLWQYSCSWSQYRLFYHRSYAKYHVIFVKFQATYNLYLLLGEADDQWRYTPFIYDPQVCIGPYRTGSSAASFPTRPHNSCVSKIKVMCFNVGSTKSDNPPVKWMIRRCLLLVLLLRVVLYQGLSRYRLDFSQVLHILLCPILQLSRHLICICNVVSLRLKRGCCW